MTQRLLACLAHIHERGIIHGDLKPLNILQVGHTLKLIDLDGAACYSKGALAGSKISSAYVPPEMLLLQADGKVSVR
eukprot:gene36680-biopygen17999